MCVYDWSVYPLESLRQSTLAPTEVLPNRQNSPTTTSPLVEVPGKHSLLLHPAALANQAWAVARSGSKDRDVSRLSQPVTAGSVKCESEQSGRALLARLGFAAISRRDLHCRDCRGREDSRSGKAGWEAGKHRLMRERSWKTGLIVKTGSIVTRLISTSTGVLCLYWEWDVCSVSGIRGA